MTKHDKMKKHIDAAADYLDDALSIAASGLNPKARRAAIGAALSTLMIAVVEVCADFQRAATGREIRK